jgi:hypothetical protein
VCLITPLLSGGTTAQVPLPTPTLLVAGPLAMIRIEEAPGRPAWEHNTRSTDPPLSGPISWPRELTPIRPAERLTLSLRPWGGEGGDIATVQLVGAPQAELQRGSALIASLGSDSRLWLEAIHRELLQGNQAMASALLFAPEAPPSRELHHMQRTRLAGGCSSKKLP